MVDRFLLLRCPDLYCVQDDYVATRSTNRTIVAVLDFKYDDLAATTTVSKYGDAYWLARRHLDTTRAQLVSQQLVCQHDHAYIKIEDICL